MPEETESEETSLESLVATLVISVTVVTPFVLLAAGVWWFWIVFVVGFAGVLPAAVQLARWYESRQESQPQSQSHTESDPLESLRERYASGEIDGAEFERRVERLLETESKTETEQFYGGRERDRSESESGSDRGESDSTDREFERELDRN
jgi:uncharacterized membrane protein